MIQTAEGLKQSIDSLGMMYRALADLHTRVAPASQANYQLLAEGPVDEIRRLQQDIHHYLQLVSQFASDEPVASQPAARIAAEALGPADWPTPLGDSRR